MNKIIYLVLLFSLFSCKKKEDDTTPAGTTAYQLDYPAYFGKNQNTPEDNPLTNEGVQLGRFLFYDTILSKDFTVSCASCHIQEHAFSDPNRLSEGVDGQLGNRQAMAIVNLLWQRDFFWDGRANSLEVQALLPIENPVEMNLSIDEAVKRLNNSEFYLPKFQKAFAIEAISKEHLAKAISQFERTLISGNSKYDQYKRNEYTLTASEERGLNLFFTHPEPSISLRGGNCNDCHSGFLTTDNELHNNGLDANHDTDKGREEFTNYPSDRGEFKTVSLRNIAVSSPYMHDGRFNLSLIHI